MNLIPMFQQPHWRQRFSLFALFVFILATASSALPRSVAGQAASERPTRNQNPTPPVTARPNRSAFTGVLIDNGTIQLGVNPEGHLIVDGGSPSQTTGTTEVGLRYMAENTDAISPDCNCEGWGIGDALTNSSGYANLHFGGAYNLNVLNFTSGIDANGAGYAISEVEVNDGFNPPFFKVTHDYHASPVTPNLYEVTVTIENISENQIEPRYRRAMDWDVEPTPFYEYVTLATGGSGHLLFASDDGFASPDPFAGQSWINFVGDAVDNGPRDHGALFDFGFAPLEPGQQFTFKIFYGATADESSALAALNAVNAEVYSLGQPSSSNPAIGTPNTYIFAFATGAPIGTPSIQVDPESLSFSLPPNQSTTALLNIHNVGTASLYWNLNESPYQTPAVAAADRGNATFDPAAVAALKPKGQDNRGTATDATVNAASVMVVEDGSFEAGSPNPDWSESSLNGPEVIGRYRFAHSGAMLAWFGGYPTYEESSISQDLVINAGLDATLRFYTMFGRCDSYDDFVEVLIDGQQVAYINGYNGNCSWPSYTEHTVNVGNFADGGTHTLTFHSVTAAINHSNTNIFVDDVSLEVYTQACELPGDVDWFYPSTTAGATPAQGSSPLSINVGTWGKEPGIYQSTICIHSNDPATPLIEVPITLTVEKPNIIISTANNGRIGTRTSADEDLMVYNQATGAWQVLFDGSDVLPATADIDAFDMTNWGSLLLSFDAPVSLLINGVATTVADADIVEFYPNLLGERTSGTFYWFLDGSDVGLTTTDEDIDAIDLRYDGLWLSTLGPATVKNSSNVNFTVQDEDLLLFTAGSWGEVTSGSFALHFDGSDVGLATTANEDIWGLWADENNNDIYLTTRGAFDTGTVSGDGNDIFVCTAITLGNNTACNYRFFWDGGAHGIANNATTGALNPIDGLNIGYVNDTISSLIRSAAADEEETNVMDIDQPGHEGDASSAVGEEGDTPVYHSHLPIAVK